ncbi:hypothetical protein BH11MYX1_BH11MYX1_44140 [soil metagenome]
MLRIAIASLLLSNLAVADGILVQGDNPKVTVAVGKTVEYGVGIRRGGWMCDDPALLTGDLVTKGDTNFFVITGVKPGSTQCRVGLEREGGFVVFDVYITAADAKPAPKLKRKP